MERFFVLVLIVGLIIGGYNCNRSTDKSAEKLTIEGREFDYDSMEREIIEEEKWIEKQKNELKERSEEGDDDSGEDLGDNLETPSM